MTVQIEFAGLQFDNRPRPPYGVYELTDFDGWYDPPSVNMSTAKLPDQPGDFAPAVVTFNSRYLTIDATIKVRPNMDVRTVFWEQFSSVPVGQPFEVTVYDPTGVKTVTAWLTGKPAFKLSTVHWMADVTIELYCPDPRKYGPVDDSIVVDATLAASGGLLLPTPSTPGGALDFGNLNTEAGFGGSWTYFNSGSADSWPWYVTHGRIDKGFSILTEGRELKYEGDIDNGSTLVLSPYAGGRAVLDGVDVTTNLTVADWVPLLAKERRRFTFQPAGGVFAGSYMTPFFREAWF